MKNKILGCSQKYYLQVILLFFLFCMQVRCDSPKVEKSIIEELQNIEELSDIQESRFLSNIRLKELEGEIDFGFSSFGKKFQYAKLLLEAGDTYKAINEFKYILDNYGGELEVNQKTKLDFYLALSYIRHGEQMNCFTLHNSESCIAPLQGKAIYSDVLPLNQAIPLLKSVIRNSTNSRMVDEAKWLLNITYMAKGEYPDSIPKNLLIDTAFFQSIKTIGVFNDIAIQKKVANQSLAGGVVMDDFDNDGRLDLMVVGRGLSDQLKYFHQEKDGSFSDRTDIAGLKGQVSSLHIVQADYNNDGWLDLFVTRGAWAGDKNGKLYPNSLLRNNGDGTFSDITKEAGMYSKYPTQVAVWADINLDGWLDLFIGNEGGFRRGSVCFKDELYLNNKNGTFTNVAKEAGLNSEMFVKGATWIDYNSDNYPDLVVTTRANQKQNIYLYKNRTAQNGGKVLFKDVTSEAGIKAYKESMFAAWSWDYNNDGYEDLFINNFGGWSNRFKDDGTGALCFKNNGDNTFSEEASLLGLDKNTERVMGCNFGDVNNDGYQDIYLGTGAPSFAAIIPNRMFLNENGQFFTDITMSARVGHLQKGHGIALGDIDNDGDLDIFAQFGGAYTGDIFQDALFENPGNENNWVSLLLEGEINKSAIGSKVVVTITESGQKRLLFRKVTSGSSFGGNSLRLELGLGKAISINKIEIKWSGSDEVQVLKDIEVNKFYKIYQGGDIVNLNLSNYESGQ